MLSSPTLETFDSHVVALLDKLDHVRGELSHSPIRLPMHVEVRRLEFWRAVICECLATLLLVFLVCSANMPWHPLDSWAPQRLYAGAFVTGFAVAVLTQCFWRSSGAHMNPALSVACAAIGRISPLRCLLYVAAQCGGSVAGAALLYGSSTPSVQGALGVTLVTPPLSAWQGFGNEFVLSFVLALVFFSVTEPCRRPLGNSAIIIGFSYMAACLAGIRSTGSSMNPARSLGPAFVMGIWKDHWIYWVAPVFASLLASFLHTRMFNPYRLHSSTQSLDLDSAASRSERECLGGEMVPATTAIPRDNNALYNKSAIHCDPVYDRPPHYNGETKSLYGVQVACGATYEDSRSIYGGARSMYAGMQPSTLGKPCVQRDNGHVSRSQSMYLRERVGSGNGGYTDAAPCSPLPINQRYCSSYISMAAPVTTSGNNNTGNYNGGGLPQVAGSTSPPVVSAFRPPVGVAGGQSAYNRQLAHRQLPSPPANYTTSVYDPDHDTNIHSGPSRPPPPPPLARLPLAALRRQPPACVSSISSGDHRTIASPAPISPQLSVSSAAAMLRDSGYPVSYGYCH